MSALGFRRSLTVALLLGVTAVACRDEARVGLDPRLEAATDCPPGQQKKGECSVEPPPPADPTLPPVAIEGLVSPLRLDRTPLDWLLVTDSRLRMVLQVDPTTLQAVAGFDTRGKPLGVAGLGSSVYVGNADARTIDVHRADGGGFASSFPPGAVEFPSDLAADPGPGLLFALDGGRREVRVFDPTGALVSVISGPGTTDDRLENPTALGLDPVRQWVLVSDYGSADGGVASLKIFSYDGALVARISGEGDCGMLGCSNGFSRPQGSAVDASGRILLADALLSQVFVYDPVTWERVGTLGERGFLRVPTDVVLDAAGDLFIASNRTREVQVIRGVGQP